MYMYFWRLLYRIYAVDFTCNTTLSNTGVKKLEFWQIRSFPTALATYFSLGQSKTAGSNFRFVRRKFHGNFGKFGFWLSFAENSVQGNCKHALQAPIERTKGSKLHQ